MKVNYILRRLSVMLGFLLLFGFSYGQSVTATYNSGAISCEYDGSATVADTSACPGVLTVTVPAGAIITGVDVSYDIVAQNWAWKSEQASFIRCLSTGGTVEASHTDGSGDAEGTQQYSRTGLTIANGVTGGGAIDFQMNLFRSYGGSACDTVYQYVVDSTWTVTVNYFIPVALDAAVSEILVTDGAVSQPVQAVVKNFGTSTLTSATVNWSVDGVSQTAYSYTGSLVQYDADTVTLGTYAFTPGTHTIEASTSLPNGSADGNTSNDTANFSDVFVGVVTSYPFVDGFEGTLDYWKLEGSHTPVVTQAPVYEGSNSMKLVGGSSTTGDMIVTLNAATDPRLSFSYWVDYYWNNEFTVYIQESDSTVWKQLHDFGTDYGSSSDDDIWITINDLDLAMYNTETNTYKIKFAAQNTSSWSTYNVFMDGVEIYIPSQNDLAMYSWNYPTASIDLLSDSVKVTVINKGTQNQSNFDIAYSVDGGTTFVTETYTGTLNAGDTLDYSFTQLGTFTTGALNCVAVVTNTGDTVNANDSLMAVYNNFAMPYMTNFDGDVANDLPLGWSLLNTTGNSNSYGYTYSSSSNAYSGSHSFALYNSSASSGDLVGIMPIYGGSTLTDKWVRFWYKGSTGSSVIIGVMDDMYDGSTFVGIDTLAISGSHTQAFVLLSSYTGTGQYIAFKHDLGGTYDYIYLDDVQLEVAPTGPIYTVNQDTVNIGNVRYNFPDTVMHNVMISNTGVGSLSIAAPTLTGTNASNFTMIDTNTYPKSLALGESLGFEVKFAGSVVGAKMADISVLAGTTTEIINLNGNVIDPTITSFPYVENFDDQSLDIGWSLRSSSGDFHWEYDNNTTGSSDTGPDGDVTGGYYIYSEASSPASQGDIASIYTNPIDFTGVTNPKMNYWYHMYGADIDTFAIEVATGGSWILVDSMIGQSMSDETDPWVLRTVDLSAYTTIDSMRFYVIRGSSYEGDVALDNIAFGTDIAVDLGPDTSSCVDPITLSGPAGSYMYEWVDLADTSVMGTTQSMTFDTTGTYVLNVMDVGYFSGTDTIMITINELPTVSFTGLGTDYCEDATAVTLTGVPAGGMFSGNGIAGSDFDPASAGPGTHGITYTYTDANGCTNTSTMSTMVNALPVLAATPDKAICLGDTATIGVNVVPVAGSLFFSQYIEGSSNNKAIEIYNGTGATVYLDNYAFPNVGNSPSVTGEYEFWNTFPAGDSIVNGDVYVIAHGSADSVILAQADMTFSYLSNGDDGFALVMNDGVWVDGDNDGIVDAGEMTGFTVVDWLGDWNGDPGAGWDVAGVTEATKDHTLIRRMSVLSGNTSWTASAGADSLSSEWNVFPQNTFTDLGMHTLTAPAGMTYAWSTTATTASIDVAPMTTTVYTVTVTDANTCASTESVEVTVNSLPTVSLGADTSLCATGSIMLDAGTFAAYAWSTAETTQTINVDTTGTGIGTFNYAVMVSDSNMCTATDTIEITFVANPVVTITAPADNKYTHDLDLSATAGFASYTWSTGGTTADITIQGSTLPYGNNEFSVVVVDANGCEGSDTVIVDILDDTDIENAENQLKVNVYPNPSNGQFNLTVDGYNGELVMNIYTANGQLVQSNIVESHQGIVHQINIQDLAKGVYHLNIQGDEASKSLRLIVQ